MSRINFLIALLVLLLSDSFSKASEPFPGILNTDDTISMPDGIPAFLIAEGGEVKAISVQDSLAGSKFKIKKRIAAILAFPFPFGLLGLHRVFLGTKPYIPFVYIGTLGGCFLILPVLDFIAILSANEEEFKRLENNPKVFMWTH